MPMRARCNSCGPPYFSFEQRNHTMPLNIKKLWAAIGLASLSAAACAQAGGNWAEWMATEMETRPNVVYAVANNQELKLDLYLPYGRVQPTPVAIYIHGGGWVTGSKELGTLRLLPFMSMGWATATVQYRLGTSSPAPAAVEDVRCALRWIVQHAGELKIDPKRIVLAGGSAGGHLALIAGMLPTGNVYDRACPTVGGARWGTGDEPAIKVAAIVNWFGITDVNDLLQGPNAKHYAIEWFGSQPEAQRERLARDISPLSHVRADTPPTISIHGDADPVVPFSHAERLHAALTQAGVANQLVAIPGGKHGSFGRPATLKASLAVREFLAAQGLVTLAPRDY